MNISFGNVIITLIRIINIKELHDEVACILVMNLPNSPAAFERSQCTQTLRNCYYHSASCLKLEQKKLYSRMVAECEP